MDTLDTLCGIVCFIGILIVAIWIFLAIRNASKEVERKIREKEERKEEHINFRKNNIKSSETSFTYNITNFFMNYSSYYGNKSFNSVYSSLIDCINRIKDENEALKKYEPSKENDCLISELTMKANQFKQFGSRVESTSFNTLILSDNYGKIDKSYWNEIRTLNLKFVDQTIDSYNYWLRSAATENFDKIDPTLIPKCAWFYATEKPYSAEKFKKACDTFFYIFKWNFADLTIAEFYAIKQMGGDDVLRNRVREMLKANTFDAKSLTMIASGLMWMNAYQEENMVLQHMLSTGQQMTTKTQNRLHSLSNGGGKAPLGFNVSSNQTKMYFDVSSLSWKDEEYMGLFENLAFQDKILSYSLAIRDEDKDLFITQGIEVPDMNLILQKINMAFFEEYGSSVSANLRHCIAMSGSGEEIINGIIAESQECKQMGILVYVARIGKKLNIKFYTLFMPSGNNLMEQKQQALSLFKKLSPSVVMWESSMKDTILMAIQQILNSISQGELVPSIKTEEKEDGLIF